MATRIIEYGEIDPRFPTLVDTTQKLVEQSPITATTTHAESSAFTTGTMQVCIDSDEDVYVAFAAAPVATTSSRKVYAKSPMDFKVTPGWKVSVRT